jgi:hypothetical protein
MNLKTGKLEEQGSRISQPKDLYKMTDKDWMYANLKDDLHYKWLYIKMERSVILILVS